MSGYDQSPREYPSLVLDDETGLLVKLEIIWTRKDSLDPAAMGEAFLERLGLEYQLTGKSKGLGMVELDANGVVGGDVEDEEIPPGR